MAKLLPQGCCRVPFLLEARQQFVGIFVGLPRRVRVRDVQVEAALPDPVDADLPREFVLHALVLGASVNVAAHPPQPEPEEYNSIHASNAVDVTVVDVLEAYASHFLAWSSRWADEGFAPVRRAWRIRAEGLDAQSEIRLPGGSIHGRADDVDERGALVLDSGGGPRRITIGEYFGLDATPAG